MIKLKTITIPFVKDRKVLNSFSSGLTFYYFVSNIVTFGQQALIRKFVDEDKIKAILEENKKKIEFQKFL